MHRLIGVAGDEGRGLRPGDAFAPVGSDQLCYQKDGAAKSARLSRYRSQVAIVRE
jgi:hypothetical protein